MRSVVAENHEGDSHIATMCLVIPLRLGIFFMACLTVIYCFLMLVSTGMQEFMRPFVGGYCRPSRICLHVCAVTGVLFGICGAIGTWYCKRTYILTFNLWQAARILAYIYIYRMDVPLLSNCEGWVNNIDGMVKEFGWNDLMYNIAMSATCPEVRTEFWVLSICGLLVLMYVAWKTHRFLEEVGKVPKHLLRISKDLSSGAWYAHSLGEKHELLGKWGKDTLPPHAQDLQAAASPPPPGPPGMPPPPGMPRAPFSGYGGAVPPQTVPPGMLRPQPVPPGMTAPQTLPPGMIARPNPGFAP